jgi:hypothetical protein
MQRKKPARRQNVDDDVDDRRGGAKSIAQYKALLRLDDDSLDEAVFQQADVYNDVGQQHLLAVSRRDEIEFELEQEIAKCDAQIRRDAARSEEKITEKQILAEIQSDPDIVAIKKDLMRQQIEVAEWSLMKSSFDQRSSMLKIAATLYSSNYFTRTSVGGTKDQIADRVRAGRSRQDDNE